MGIYFSIYGFKYLLNTASIYTIDIFRFIFFFMENKPLRVLVLLFLATLHQVLCQKGSLLNIQGRGEYSVQPDHAVVKANVKIERKSSIASLQAAQSRLEDLVKLLKTYNVSEKQLSTSILTISCSQKKDQNRTYILSQDVSIKVKNFTNITKTINQFIRDITTKLELKIYRVFFYKQDFNSTIELARKEAKKDVESILTQHYTDINKVKSIANTSKVIDMEQKVRAYAIKGELFKPNVSVLLPTKNLTIISKIVMQFNSV